MEHKGRKISVLGTGNVGATIAYSMTLLGIASEIVLVDVNKEKAKGEALDLSQCAACVPSVKIRCGEYEDVAGSDVIIVTFGVGRKPDQTRLDLAKINVGILKSVMPTVAKIAPDALYIIVSNPVDVLTYATLKCTGLPQNRVIGTGTLLDSSRLIKAVADFCEVDAHNVSAYVLGEHGDASMTPWSICTVAGMKMDDFAKRFLNLKDEELESTHDTMFDALIKSGAAVIKAKGATYYAIAASVMHLLKAILYDTHSIMTLSTLVNGEYGGKNICMGVPCMVGAKGLEKIVELPITDSEKAVLNQKVASLTATYDTLGIRE